jgi:hypothetical protein
MKVAAEDELYPTKGASRSPQRPAHDQSVSIDEVRGYFRREL